MRRNGGEGTWNLWPLIRQLFYSIGQRQDEQVGSDQVITSSSKLGNCIGDCRNKKGVGKGYQLLSLSNCGIVSNVLDFWIITWDLHSSEDYQSLTKLNSAFRSIWVIYMSFPEEKQILCIMHLSISIFKSNAAFWFPLLLIGSSPPPTHIKLS